jgi:hypothetical protein
MTRHTYIFGHIINFNRNIREKKIIDVNVKDLMGENIDAVRERN